MSNSFYVHLSDHHDSHGVKRVFNERNQCLASLIKPAQSSRQYLRAAVKVKKFSASPLPHIRAAGIWLPGLDQTCLIWRYVSGSLETR